MPSSNPELLLQGPFALPPEQFSILLYLQQNPKTLLRSYWVNSQNSIYSFKQLTISSSSKLEFSPFLFFNHQSLSQPVPSILCSDFQTSRNLMTFPVSVLKKKKNNKKSTDAPQFIIVLFQNVFALHVVYRTRFKYSFSFFSSPGVSIHRRMFPVLHFMMNGLDPNKLYHVFVDMVVADNSHWKFQGGNWISCGTAEVLPESEYLLNDLTPRRSYYRPRRQKCKHTDI